jgi:pSer/pThr/pTyr-binding forkhead associated (FHA) protein
VIAYLQPVRPPGPPRRLQLGRQFLIGRLASCDLVLDQPTISRRHAVIYQCDGSWFIADAGASTGTFVNSCLQSSLPASWTETKSA